MLGVRYAIWPPGVRGRRVQAAPLGSEWNGKARTGASSKLSARERHSIACGLLLE